VRTQKLEALRVRFLKLQALADRQQAGRGLEQLLSGLFEEFGLDPKGGFRVTGEQIDGSFLLHQEVYLLKAKWTDPVREADLLIFRGKLEGKANFTRGCSSR